MSPRRTAVGAALGLVLLGATGCSTTLGDVPLPGTGVAGDTIEVQAEFAEALNLAQGATVKVNGVDSGKVQGVGVADFRATADMLVSTDAQLREGATARLRYTTPLGELYVDVTNPAEGPLLDDGDLLTLADTSTAPTVENALSQASLLINGGGLTDLQTITEELNTALGGREGNVRALLERARTFLAEANGTTADLDRTLRALDSVAQTLADRQDVINRAVREIRPAAEVLRARTPDFTALLEQVRSFSAVANDTVARTRDDLLTVLRAAQPVFAEFAGNERRFPESLRALVSLSRTLNELVPNDYLAIAFTLRLEQTTPPDLLDTVFGVLDGLGGVLGGVLGRPDAVPQELAPLTARGLTGGAR
ncbi:MCE family protein [Nocardioides sp.]|uniref:MCE family protein n=1 Tax=Nocardioides sp. TaxID=35761 RepID=UPI003513A21C